MIKRLFLVSAFLFSGQASAIPVADASTLAQTIADAALQMAQQMFIEKLEQELAEQGIESDEELAELARELSKDQFEERRDVDGYGWKTDVGNSGLYSGSNSVSKNAGNVYIPKNSNDLDSAVSDYDNKVNDAYREKHGLKTDSPYLQESFDKELSYRAMLDSAYIENNQRFKMIDELRAQANSAATPQAKADLELAIQVEQTAIMNENLRMKTVNEMKQQEARLEDYRLNEAAYNSLTE